MIARLRDGRRIAVTVHAQERYLERVLSGHGDAARVQEHLGRLIETVGVLSRLRPEWACSEFGNPADVGTDCYLLLGPDIALPVAHGRAITVLARGHISDVARADRNHRNRAERARKRSKRRELSRRPEGLAA